MGTSTNARQSVEKRSGHQLVADIIDNGEVSFQQILVIVLCLIFNMVDGFDITTMAIVATSVSNELELSADKLGWIFSFALAGMVIGAMGIAPLSDIIGRRKIIIMSLLLVGVSILLTAKASSLTEFIVLRFISGLGAGSMLACQATLASEYSNEKFRALSVNIVVAGYPLGALMTAVVASYIMPDYGWRGIFWFGGGATVLMSITAMLFIPESLKYLFEQQPAGALKKVNKILVKLKRDTLSTLPSITKSTTAKGGMANNVKALLSVDHRTKTLILWSSFFLGFATLYVLMSWIPKLVEDAGYSAEIGRSAFFWFNLGGVVGIFISGTLAVRYSLTSVISALLVGSALAMAVFASVSAELKVMMLIIFGIGLLQQGGFTGLYAAAAKAYPTEIRATGIGWCAGLGRFGAVIGPATAGYMIAAGFDMSAIFYTFAVPMAVGGLFAYALKIK
ncbi:MAG: MFS transporter [Arenicellaceae bacterium]|nr:MFS transporter [Arenicellaceae bacterium]